MRLGRGLFCCALLTYGAAASAADDAADDAADEALLEFLGSFDDGEGNWLDPTELLRYDVGDRVRREEDEETNPEDDEQEAGKQENDDIR